MLDEMVLLDMACALELVWNFSYCLIVAIVMFSYAHMFYHVRTYGFYADFFSTLAQVTAADEDRQRRTRYHSHTVTILLVALFVLIGLVHLGYTFYWTFGMWEFFVEVLQR